MRLKEDKILLVTGAGGYIGTHLVRKALNHGYKVKAFDRYFFGKDKLASLEGHPDLEIITGDIRSISKEVFSNVYAAVDLAGISNDPSSDLDPLLTTSVNLDGCVRVAKMAKENGVHRYIAMSSCSVYGAAEGLCNESTPPNPVSLYAKIKSQMEESVMPLEDNNFCISTLRNSTGFGPSDRMRFDLVVNAMTLACLQQGKLFVNGTGGQHRPLLHAEDVAGVCCNILGRDTDIISGEVFNVGAFNATVTEIAQKVQLTLKKLLERNINLEYIPNDLDIRDYEVSFEKYKTAFGELPYITIEQAVEDIIIGLQSGRFKPDESTFTVQRYKSLIKEHGSSLLLS